MYLHQARPSAHARTPQVMNAEFARRGVDAVAVSADVTPGRPRRVRAARLLDEAAARRCVPHPGLPMLAGQVDLVLDFLGPSGTGQFHDRERF